VYGVQCTSQLKALRRGAFGPVHKATLHPIELGAQRNMESILGFSSLKQEHKITKQRLKTVNIFLEYIIKKELIMRKELNYLPIFEA
jgi:hypothetical protein